MVVYNDDGLRFDTLAISTGTKAGCVSGSKLFNAALSPVDDTFVFRIVDDIHVIFDPKHATAEDMKQEMRRRLEFTGINFFGPKTAVIDQSSPPLKILGAVIAPIPSLPLEHVFEKIQRPVFDLMEKIVTLKVPLQVRFNLLRTAQLRLKFVYRVTHLQQARKFAEAADETITSIFLRSFDLTGIPRANLALIHPSVEQGGLGMANLRMLWPLFWNKRVTEMNTVLRALNYDILSFDNEGPNANIGEAEAISLQIPNFYPNNIIWESVRIMKKTRQAHLLNVVPRDAMVLPDEVFQALLYSKLQYLPITMKAPCHDDPEQSVYRHHVSCPKCRQGTVRHNTVL
jgi:hypothetical protein